jgi:outer membrane lipoprotein-sorting protein
MKFVSLCIAFIGWSFISTAQTAEEIIEKYLQNLGGSEKLNSINSLEMKAKVDYGGMTIPIDMITLRDGRTVTKINFQGQEMIQGAFDGTTSWGTNFMTMKPEKNDAETTENVKRTAGTDFMTPMLDYKKKGYSVEMLPNETIEGVECFKLKVTKKPQMLEGKEVPNIEFYYFDKENYVPIVVEAEIPSGQMKGQISQTVFSDYQEVDGIYFAFSMTQKIKDGQGQTIVFDSIELNKKYEDSIFKFPGE